MQCLPMIRALVLSSTPLASEDDYRLEILVTLRRLERLDKDEYSEEEKQEAEEVYEQRRLEEMNNEVRIELFSNIL